MIRTDKDYKFDELKAECMYYRNILDDLCDRTNLYGANAYEELKNHITFKPTMTDCTKQIYFTITVRKRKSSLKDWFLWLFCFHAPVFETSIRTPEKIGDFVYKLQYAGYNQIEIVCKTGDIEY